MKLSDVKVWAIDLNRIVINPSTPVVNIPAPPKLPNLPGSKPVIPNTFNKQPIPGPGQNLIQPKVESGPPYMVPLALVGIKFLSEKVGPNNVWLLSQSYGDKNKLIREKLEKMAVFSSLGIPKDNLLFYPSLADKTVIVRALEIDGILDHSPEAIYMVQPFVTCPVLFSPVATEIKSWIDKITYRVRIVSGWKTFFNLF